jgi:quinol monooxygenase YgiN
MDISNRDCCKEARAITADLRSRHEAGCISLPTRRAPDTTHIVFEIWVGQIAYKNRVNVRAAL